MTTTKLRFANNFELGAIEACFEEIQAKYEAIEAMEPADPETADPATSPFWTSAAEIDQQYDDLVNLINVSRSAAREAISGQERRVFPIASAKVTA